MSDEFNFDDLQIKEKPVTIQGVNYVLREANGDAACKYRNALLGQVELGSDGVPKKLGKVADVEPMLVSLCISKVQGEGKPIATVNEQDVRRWPNRVIKPMFEWIKKNSDLEEEESQLSKELRQALDNEDSPFKMAQLREWVNHFPQNQLTELRKLIEPTPEELAKNEQSGTGNG